jgi:hypothetical protein
MNLPRFLRRTPPESPELPAPFMAVQKVMGEWFDRLPVIDAMRELVADQIVDGECLKCGAHGQDLAVIAAQHKQGCVCRTVLEADRDAIRNRC